MFDPTPAADLLSAAWSADLQGDLLPVALAPTNRAQGYAIQRLIDTRLGPAAGWKIAATSLAGQKHIAVSGPLAGPVFANRVQGPSATVSLRGNRMRVAECEVVFRMARDLPVREETYSMDEVLDAVDGIGPGIEVPDSRFAVFEKAGEAQLIADCACCRDMVLGDMLPIEGSDARLHQLAGLRVQARVSDGRAFEGVGSNVLGDPAAALTWLANELNTQGLSLKAGQFVTTGACVVPIAVLPGQQVQADYGWLGTLGASFV
ncbi:MAG: 2-keto-4-pentenoate hydratase [Burkholderiaceae bacterium]